MRRPSPSLLALLLLPLLAVSALPARQPSAQNSAAKRPAAHCAADQILAEKEAVLSDLRAGRYCTVCLRTLTEFRKSSQDFDAHFKNADAKKARGAAPASVVQRKTKLYERMLAERCGQSQDCEALYAYRDHELYKEWDRAVAKFTIFSQARNDLRRHREKLLSENRWKTSNWTLMGAEVAKTLEATSDLVLNLIELHPTGAYAGRVIKAGKTRAARVYQNLDDGKKIKKIVDGELLEVVWDEVLTVDSLPAARLRKSAKAVKDLAKAVKEMRDLKQQQDELKTVIKEELDKIDAAIDQQEENLKNSRRAVESLDAIRQGIDSYCLDQSRKLQRGTTLP